MLGLREKLKLIWRLSMINDDKLVQIINYFTSQNTEKPHVEFKMNNDIVQK